MTDLFSRTTAEKERLAPAPATERAPAPAAQSASAAPAPVPAPVIPAVAILSLVDELRRRQGLVRIEDRSGTFWIAEGGGIGFCDRTARAAWDRGLLYGDLARRIALRPAEQIAPIVAALEAEHEQAKARARAAGRFVS